MRQIKKIKITSNKGKIFDWCLNTYLNFMLWFYGIYDDEEKAIELCASVINKLKKICRT